MPKQELMDRIDLPYLSDPSGWFQIGWSHEYEVGTVRRLRYFGEELVGYRVTSGKLFAIDAYCPHFGAHLGHGGRVENDCLVCPFHGWTWDADGANVAIPYSSKLNKSKRLVHHPVEERDGLIYTWHSSDSAKPNWSPPNIPELTDDTKFFTPYSDACQLWEHSVLMPQFILENNVDYAHLKYLHLWDQIPAPEPVQETTDSFRSVFHGTLSTKQGPSKLTIDTISHGVGLSISRMYGVRDATSVVCATPVDELHSDVRVTVAVQRFSEDGETLPKVVQGIRQAQLITTFEQDIPVWGNMKYNVHPPYPREEAHDFVQLRKWSEKFYPQLHDAP